MPNLELTPHEKELLRDNLDIDLDAWEDVKEKLSQEPFGSWEELLDHHSFSEEMLALLKKVRDSLE
jgi:hypothetical protein